MAHPPRGRFDRDQRLAAGILSEINESRRPRRYSLMLGKGATAMHAAAAAVSRRPPGMFLHRVMLVGALGCNLAWGLIDAMMYLMASLAERAADLRTVAALRKAATEKEA